jgi:hypothetical protein
MAAEDTKNTNPRHAELVRDPELREDPTIRAARKAKTRMDDGEAFLPDPSRESRPIAADDGTSFGEEFIASATTGEPLHMDAADEVADDEEGGPFLELEGEEDIPSAPNADFANDAQAPSVRTARNPRRSVAR